MKPQERLGLVAVALASVVGMGITLTRPFEAPTALPERSWEDPQVASLATLVDERFGRADAPRLPAAFDGVATGDVAAGRASYLVQCLHCHGADGHADTYTARLLTPAPRDFSHGVVKFTRTASDLPAQQADLERTLERGLDSTAMSSFANLPEEERRDLAAYVMHLLVRGAVFEEARGRLDQASPAEALAAAEAAEAGRWQAAAAADPEPPARPQLMDAAAGARLYASAGCFACHGEDGRGMVGDVTLSLGDRWGGTSRVRDLREGPLLGGGDAVDLYWRIRSGIKGGPMPATESQLSPEETWALVAHLQSLRTR